MLSPPLHFSASRFPGDSNAAGLNDDEIAQQLFPALLHQVTYDTRKLLPKRRGKPYEDHTPRRALFREYELPEVFVFREEYGALAD